MTTLIDTQGIADLLGVTRDYATSSVVKRPDFPAPSLRLSQKTVRWDRAAVLAWIEGQRIRAGRRSVQPSIGSRPATATGHGDR
jgi:predicted DNA-binding transcriptional regulator AlpA